MPSPFATYASAAIVCVASLVVGRAIMRLLGREDVTWLEPAVGLSALLVVASATVRAPGDALTSLIASGVLVLAALVYLRGKVRPGGNLAVALAVVAIVAAATAIPFIANDRIGIVGVGINNDLAAHLLWTDWLRDPVADTPVGIDFGYPLGPHAMGATLSEATGQEALTSILGLIIAIPVLTGLAALSFLSRSGPLRAIAVASVVALPYLLASFLSIGGFKEQIMALLLLSFVAALRELELGAPRTTTVIAIGVILAGALATYSYPGLYWPVATAGLWGAARLVILWRQRGFPQMTGALRSVLPLLGAAAAIAVVLALTELPRVLDLRESGAVSNITDARATLRQELSPAEGLLVWPSGEFLEGTSALDVPALWTALGIAAGLFGLVWWARRGELTVPAAIIGSAVIYFVTREVGGIYVEAKALAIPGALIALLAATALLGVRLPAAPASAGGDSGEATPPRDGGNGLGAMLALPFGIALVGLAAYSSFLVLRDTPVAAADRSEELDQFRDRIRGSQVLSLVTDRYADYYLRGATVSAPRPNADRFVAPRTEKAGRLPLDFDSVEPELLDEFDYAITTSTRFQSHKPPGYEVVEQTEQGSFLLWERVGDSPGDTFVINEDARPGRVFECRQPEYARLARRQGMARVWSEPPILANRASWFQRYGQDIEESEGDEERIVRQGIPGEFDNSIEPGESVRRVLHLAPGPWDISIQYASPQAPVSIHTRSEGGQGISTRLPASLDGVFRNRLDAGPFWHLGRLVSGGQLIRVFATVDKVGRLQQILGAEKPTELGNLVATRPAPTSVVPLGGACDRYLDRYSFGAGR